MRTVRIHAAAAAEAAEAAAWYERERPRIGTDPGFPGALGRPKCARSVTFPGLRGPARLTSDA